MLFIIIKDGMVMDASLHVDEIRPNMCMSEPLSAALELAFPWGHSL